MKWIGVLALLSGLAWPVLAKDVERTTENRDQQALSVTIYNDNLALVKDVRSVELDRGANVIAWRDVSARIRPETALLKAMDGTALVLQEQNFDFDLLSPQKLLEKYVGQSVSVVRTHPQSGEETREKATVLAANSGVVLRFADRIETGAPGRIVFDTLPPGLRDRPTLSLSLLSPDAGRKVLELDYLTGGLSWRADYVAELNQKEDFMDLGGWVTLTNTSGASYTNARLQLVAGDVNRLRPETRRMPEAPGVAAKALVAAAPVTEEGLFEYHLYTLDRPTTIASEQTKQVALLSASRIPVHKEFLLQGRDYYYHSSYGELGKKLKVGVFMEFENRSQDGLGIPLPKGVLRVYKKDSAERVQFVGEDRIDHTPRNEKLRIKLGEAFDVTADRKQTDFQKVAGNIYESAFQIDLRNAKDVPVTVVVAEPVPGDWEMLSQNREHQKAASNKAVWRVPIPASGKTSLTYRVRMKF